MTNQCATCGCQLDYPTATHIIDCSQPTPKPRLFHLERGVRPTTAGRVWCGKGGEE